MTKGYEDMKNTMMKTLVKMIEVEEQGVVEMLQRTKAAITEAQSSVLPSGVLPNDAEHIENNMDAIVERVTGFATAILAVVEAASIMDVDMDQSDVKVL
jgi:hypothetical protein